MSLWRLMPRMGYVIRCLELFSGRVIPFILSVAIFWTEVRESKLQHKIKVPAKIVKEILASLKKDLLSWISPSIFLPPSAEILMTFKYWGLPWARARIVS